MDFLDTLETIRAESASVSRLFGGEGTRAPSRAGTPSPAYQAKLAEAVKFVADVMSGRMHGYQLREAMTRSDFPVLFGDILDRQVQAAYVEKMGTWTATAKRRTVRDFRPTRLYKPISGAGGRLAPVGELDEYPEAVLNDTSYQDLTVGKVGRRMAISWEALINDDLDQLKDLPNAMGRAARRTENYMATELYAGASGPDSTLYTDANKNLIDEANGAEEDNPALGVAGLTQGLLVFGNQVNEDGDPIETEAVTLVIPPALEVIANNILNATSLELTNYGGVSYGPLGTGGETRLLAANWLSRRVKIMVNPLLPLIDLVTGNTAWYLFGDPNTGREATAMCFLRGWETPSVYQKSSNARRVGGGEVDPLEGDFDTDASEYKIRHVIGAAQVDPKATVASTGVGGTS